MRAALFASFVLVACRPAPAPAPEGLVPDFHLADVNPGSARYGQDVSPRDYLGKVSGWYFGHST